MANVKFTNLATTRLAADITASQTTFNVLPGTGLLFPVLSTGQWFYVTIVDSDAHMEIVKVISRNVDTFTVERGVDRTSARAFDVGSLVDLRANAAALEDISMGSGAGASGNFLKYQAIAPNNPSFPLEFQVYADASSGDDGNDGITEGSPVKTWSGICKVLSRLALYYPLRFLVVNLKAGTYIQDGNTSFLSKDILPYSVVTIRGDGYTSTFLESSGTSLFTLDTCVINCRDITFNSPVNLDQDASLIIPGVSSGNTVRFRNNTHTSTHNLVSVNEGCEFHMKEQSTTIFEKGTYDNDSCVRCNSGFAVAYGTMQFTGFTPSTVGRAAFYGTDGATLIFHTTSGHYPKTWPDLAINLTSGSVATGQFSEISSSGMHNIGSTFTVAGGGNAVKVLCEISDAGAIKDGSIGVNSVSRTNNGVYIIEASAIDPGYISSFVNPKQYAATGYVVSYDAGNTTTNVGAKYTINVVGPGGSLVDRDFSFTAY